MPLLTGRTQVVMKVELVPGTMEVLEAAGALVALAEPILADNVTWEPDAAVVDRSALTASIGGRGSVVGGRSGKIGFRTQLRGTTAAFAAANLPDVHIPFEACGCSVTMSGGAGAEIVTIAPVSAITNWCTVAAYNDGIRYTIAGALGDVTLTFKVGEPVTADWTFTGAYCAPVDMALRSTLAVALPAPPPFLAATMTVQAYATARVSNMTFALGNTVVMQPDPNSLTGMYRAAITSRRPGGSIDPESVLVASKNYYNEWVTNAYAALTTGLFPSTGAAYNKINLTCPKMKYKKAGLSDDGGIRRVPIDYEACESADAGDDCFSLVFSF